MSIKTFKILIYGKVQGVFFRVFIKEKADSLDIKGFTRNILGGYVEVIGQSNNEESFKKFIKFLKIGPKLAKVEKLEIVSCETRERAFEDFEIR